MKDFLSQRLAWIAAVLVFATGVVMTLGTVRLLRAASLSAAEQARGLRTLERFADDLDRYVAARGAYEKVPGGRAVRLETVLRETLDADRIEDVREARTDIGDGWVLRRKEVVLGETPMQDVMAAIRGAEAQRPPWLLAECVIRAAALTPGHGRAVLTFEALERSSATVP